MHVSCLTLTSVKLISILTLSVLVTPALALDPALPLLDPAKVRAPFAVFCDGGPDGTGAPAADDTPLPVDPRTLVVPGINDSGAAVAFNGYWIELHDPPGFRSNPLRRAQTCGDWRARIAAGENFLESRQTFQLLGSALAYHDIWKAWGLAERPSDFDQQVRQRYGLSAAKFRNPYPLPGEDPRTTNGGSGQLPLGLIQGRDRDLGYNGKITISCSACHDSQLGSDADGLGFHWGRASDAFDPSLFGAELIRAGAMDGELPAAPVVGAALLPFPYSGGRGINDAFGLIDFLAALFDMETLDVSPGVEVFPLHGAPSQVQTPNWWNRAHRTRMFLGGDLSADNVRSAMALDVANVDRTGAEKKATEPEFENVVAFLESLSPPAYPRPVDTALAEAGAILFHAKDLWADPVNRDLPRPPTNGSCAGCHGVYSPRFAADPRWLPDPRLKGIAGYITPIDEIRTDPARTRLASKEFKVAWDTSWWGYDELNFGWTPQGQGAAGQTLARAINDYSGTNMRLSGPNAWEKDVIGYDTPPLYGVWASAPYFHNGSVPTVWGVLRPSQRPAVWQRPLLPPSTGGIVQGLDPSFAAYDFDDLGWKFTEIPCNAPIRELASLTCNPGTSPLGMVEGVLSNTLGPQLWLANQMPPPIDENDRKRRMIYDSYDYGLGNGGHEFTQALTDEEARAIIEYLKTL